MKSIRLGTATPQFKEEIQTLKQALQEHVDHEERDLFAKLWEHMSEAQLVELGQDFQLVKKRLQDSFHSDNSLMSSAQSPQELLPRLGGTERNGVISIEIS